jgi:hypothetical protein
MTRWHYFGLFTLHTVGGLVSGAIVAGLCLLLLTGCLGASQSRVTGPDGTAQHRVKCAADPTKCYAMASDSCAAQGGTYRVLASESHAGGLWADVLAGPVTWYGMTYTCGPSDGRTPDFAFGGQQYIPPTPPQRRTITIVPCSQINGVTICNRY